MFSSRTRRLSLVVGVVALGLLVLLYPTDEKRVREVAESLLAAANESEGALSVALQQHATPQLSLLISDLPEALEGHSAVLSALGRAQVMGRRLRFRMEQVEVSVEGNHARLTADVVASLQLGLREHRQARRATALFEKVAGRFVLASVEVGRQRHDQPEERP